MKEVISMASKTDNSKYITPKQTLEECLELIDSEAVDEEGAWPNCNKLLVIALDNDGKETYSISWCQSNMSMSECIALCEVAKTTFLEQMGYLQG